MGFNVGDLSAVASCRRALFSDAILFLFICAFISLKCITHSKRTFVNIFMNDVGGSMTLIRQRQAIAAIVGKQGKPIAQREQ